jgi:hypothetical protein
VDEVAWLIRVQILSGMLVDVLALVRLSTPTSTAASGNG